MAETVAAALARARSRLEAAGVAGATRDAGRLMAHVAGQGADVLTYAQTAAFDALIDRRVRREPVSHLLGRRAFWKHDFEVTSDVLDPRPDTETLVEAALEGPFDRVLDLGTGSGCILLSLLAERPAATGVGTDISEAALAVAERNADRLEVSSRAALQVSDWFAAVTGSFDLIVSNPPYITAAEMAGLEPEVRDWEPHAALTPGGDGLDAYRAITTGAPAHLAPGGRLIVEIGWQQAPAVTRLFEEACLANIRVIRDLGGKDRVVSGQK